MRRIRTFSALSRGHFAQFARYSIPDACLLPKLSNKTCWNTCNNAVTFNVSVHNSSRSDDRPFADFHARQKDRARANPSTGAYSDRLDSHVTSPLHCRSNLVSNGQEFDTHSDAHSIADLDGSFGLDHAVDVDERSVADG